MPRSIGRDPFTAMTITMQLVNKKRKENCAPLLSSADTLCDTTTTTKKKKKKSLVSPHVSSQPGKPKRKKHTPSRRRRNTNNNDNNKNNNNTLTDDIAATSLLLLRTSSTTTTTTTFSGGGFGGEEEGCGLVFSSLPSLSEGKVGGNGGGGGAKDVKVDKSVASPARAMLSTPPQQPKTRMKIRVVLPLLALSAKRRADLGKLYDARELLKRVKAVKKMF